MIYQQTKFGCQRISSSKGITEIVIFWSYEPLSWPWLCRSCKYIYLHNTLAHHAASTHQVLYQNNLWFWRYHLDKHSLTFWTFAKTLPLNIVILFFFTRHSSLWCCTSKKNLVANLKQTSSLEDRVETVISRLYKPLLWAWPWRQQPNFSAWHYSS